MSPLWVHKMGKVQNVCILRTTIRLVGHIRGDGMLNVTEITCRENKGNSCAEGLQWTLNMLLFSI